MKKTHKQSVTATDDMLPEYDFDYSKAKPNRFAGRIERSQVVIALDPDVAKIFSDSASVNNVLRALITTIPNLTPKPVKKAA